MLPYEGARQARGYGCARSMQAGEALLAAAVLIQRGVAFEHRPYGAPHLALSEVEYPWHLDALVCAAIGR